MKYLNKKTALYIVLALLMSVSACKRNEINTRVEVRGNKFYINGAPTYKGKEWNGSSIEGLLFNARMVQGIFDDSNEHTRQLWKYPGTDKWEPDRNTNEFIKAMDEWHRYGLLAFTINLQGGSPKGYGNDDWINTAFNPDGSLKKKYFTRLYRILTKSDDLGMAVILGLFYFGQDEQLADEQAILNAIDNTLDWLNETGFRNVIIEINNECNGNYDHEILQPERVHELIDRVKKKRYEGYSYPAGVSYGGGTLPGVNVIKASDVIFLHGNGIDNPDDIREMVRRLKVMPEYNAQPVVFNEDDHYGFDEEDYNMKAAVESYASWGFFDYRRQGEGFEQGFQSVPVDWGINSDRKKDFFNKIKEITGGN
ncbi:MAG TPA: hypothetical protein DEQ09_12850 [Bacteroidales bacterium]|nr:hypothetical protein [Bacteroidales bacterium]